MPLQSLGRPDHAPDDIHFFRVAFIDLIFGIERLDDDLGWFGIGNMLDAFGNDTHSIPDYKDAWRHGYALAGVDEDAITGGQQGLHVPDISAYGTVQGDCVREDFWLIVTARSGDETEIRERERSCRTVRS